ncbi:MAG: SET domain-containing protein-lysine N-methyltransferase [Simkaniaceae bacterium]|nr:SET domain-containing protein-lysine N-methyltransferase [Simkaniaceae bacterium]
MRKFKVQKKGSTQLEHIEQGELERLCSFVYLDRYRFESERDREKFIEGGKKLRVLRIVSQKEIDLAARYHGQELDPKGYSIRYISDSIGYGAYAERNLPKGEIIGSYVGHIRREGISPYYRFAYPYSPNVLDPHYIDAIDGNFTRFINHSEKANLQVLFCYNEGLFHVLLETLREIKKGEQFLYDYGDSYWLEKKPLNLE